MSSCGTMTGRLCEHTYTIYIYIYTTFAVCKFELNLMIYIIYIIIYKYVLHFGFSSMCVCHLLLAATALSCICSSIMRCCGNAPTTPLLEHAAALSQRAEADETKKPALFYPMYTAA